MRLLVIGGTRFVGRALVERALARGDEVTVFTRGLHGADLFPQAEHLRGDRTVDLSPLAGRRFDAVVDTCGYVPRDVGASVRALRGSVGAYVLVSSASAYTHWPAQPVDETSQTFTTAASAGPEDGHYGELKAGCERAVADGFGERGLILRPGLIVGPHEHVGRLPAWLRRAARGGEMLAPGTPGDPLQLVDARDLAAFALAAVDGGLSGACNVASDPGSLTIGALLAACVAATGSRAAPRFVAADVLAAHGVEPWSDLPLWAPASGETAGVFAVSNARARRHGLQLRPLAATVRDTWQWLRAAPVDEEIASLGLPPEREREVLVAVDAARG